MRMKPLITRVQSLCTASSATIHTSKQIKAKSFTYAQDASKPKSFGNTFYRTTAAFAFRKKDDKTHFPPLSIFRCLWKPYSDIGNICHGD